MTIKSDGWIKRMALEHKMIEPFVDSQTRSGVISYGVSSYGYDIRVADEFKVFTNVYNTVVDPKNFDPRSFVDIKADVCIIPPNSFALARTIEYFRIPRDVLTVCLGKSTYARCGIIGNVTPFEPEGKGSHDRDFEHDAAAGKIYPTRGCPGLFFQSDEVCCPRDKKEISGSAASLAENLGIRGVPGSRAPLTALTQRKLTRVPGA
jgi:dCTP deaminase